MHSTDVTLQVVTFMKQVQSEQERQRQRYLQEQRGIKVLAFFALKAY